MLFDFGGTLDADGVPWKTRFFRLVSEEGVPVSSASFDPVFYAADDALVGTIPRSLSFHDTVHRVATGLLQGLGCDDECVRERVVSRFVGDALTALRRNAPLLERLKQRFRLGIVSNFYGNLPQVCADAGLLPLLDAIVDSTHAGYTKPDARIFKTALAQLGVAAEHATLVGDSLPRDMHGARDAGLRHVWLAGETADTRAACCPGDPVLRRLTDLEAALRD